MVKQSFYEGVRYLKSHESTIDFDVSEDSTAYYGKGAQIKHRAVMFFITAVVVRVANRLL